MKVVHAHPEKIKYCDPVDGRFPPIKLLAWLVRAYRPKDRTGLFNNLNFEYSPIPKVESGWRKTFDTCCYDRAEELWSVGKPITLFWSGGIDSTAAFVALAQTKESNSVAIKQEEIATEKELKGLEIGQQIASDLLANEQLDKKAEREDYIKGLDIGIDIAKDITKNEK